MADGITIKIDGIKELQNTFKLISDDILDIIADAVEDGGEIVKNGAKAKVHVVSGNLKQSIDILHTEKSKDKVEVQIGSGLPYAAKEEFRVGGKYPGSHSYMRYSLDTNEAAVEAAIKNKISSRLTRYK